MFNFHSKIKKTDKNEQFSSDLEDNCQFFKETFSYPKNVDFLIRPIEILSLEKKAFLFFLNGMTDTQTIEDKIIRPLTEKVIEINERKLAQELIDKILITNQIKIIDVKSNAISEILNGNTVLLIDGLNQVLSISSTKYDYRSIDKPQSENVIKGTNEGFSESGQVNLSLIRKRIRDENLITENLQIGNGKTNVRLLYLKNVANDDLVDAAKKRVKEIKAESVDEISVLEQHLEERPYSLVPTILYTERPDRATSFIREGFVALVMESSPGALIVPVTFWSFFHTSEDYYLKWAYGNFIRIIRLFAVFVSLLTPSFYVAIVNYHSAMIPTDLLLAIAATRETVPFPVIVEVLIMEFSFEILREAGIRIPTPMGPTIGIVGALILGQAAVDANIISPILVIIVAITGLSSFAIPNVSFNFMVRIARFGMFVLAAFMGFYGVTIGIVMCVAYLSTTKSFGVPFLAPLSPYFPSSRDTVLRKPIWKEWIKPMFLSPKDKDKNSKTKGKKGL